MILEVDVQPMESSRPARLRRLMYESTTNAVALVRASHGRLQKKSMYAAVPSDESEADE